MPQQFFFEHAPGLNEQTAVDRFVGDLHGALRWKFTLEPARDLFGRPIQYQFACNESLERWLCRKATAFGPSGAIPRPRIRFSRPIAVGPTMPMDFPTDGRRHSTERGRNLSDRAPHCQAARNFFSFR